MPAIKSKEGGPLPSKTLQFTDFKKGMMRTGARDGIPEDALWDCINAQVIGPGHIITLTEPGASIATAPAELVSLWGVMIQLDTTETERLIGICADGSAFAIDPNTGTITAIAPAGSIDPTARVTMWRDTHVLFAGVTTGFASWDGENFLTYPVTFEGTTTTGSTAITWFDGPTPVSALVPGMAVSGIGIPGGSAILAVGGEDLAAPASFNADTVNGFPTLLWTSGPTLPDELQPGVVISGTGLPAGATITSVVGEDLPAGAPFTANTVSASSQMRYTGGLTPVDDLLAGLRVVGAGIPAGATLVSVIGDHIPVNSLFNAKTINASNKLTYLGGALALDQIIPGLLITGAGIPAGTTISAISGTELTISKNATATAATTPMTVGPTLTLSVNATATAANVPITTGPTITVSANATATSSAVVMTVKATITLNNNATASGTVTLTIGAGVPKGTIADPESKGPRDLAVFEGRVWLVSGNRGLIYSGTSFTAWGPAYSGFATTMPDSVFPGQITTIRAAVQLLWIFGPGAINTISNVQVINGITTFQNENLVAGTGTALADSVHALFRTMVFLSPPGVYAILGATPQKLSDQLDGMMPDVSPVGSCPGAVFNLNALLCYVVLVDIDGQRRLLCYSRPAWLVADQGADLKWITTLVRTDGQIQCWGTNGTTIRQLFAGQAGDYDIRLKMYDFGMFTRRDTIRRLAVQAEVLAQEGSVPFDPDLQVEVENETTTTGTVGGLLASAVTWINNDMIETPWINNVAGPVTWVAQGNLIYLSEVKFSGNLLSAHIFGRQSVPLIIGGVAMEVGLGGEWTFAP